jgi:CheY-like chemotaxis protein
MTGGSSRTGGDFLARRDQVARGRQGLPSLKDLLIVEDETFDANRLRATLHILFGYDADIRRAATLGTAVDCVIERKPDLVFLDDYLKPADTATHTIPFLRRAGYEGPIIVLSGQVDRQRKTELLAAGADDVIHKDDVDSVRLGEALVRVFANRETNKLAAQ